MNFRQGTPRLAFQRPTGGKTHAGPRQGPGRRGHEQIIRLQRQRDGRVACLSSPPRLPHARTLETSASPPLFRADTRCPRATPAPPVSAPASPLPPRREHRTRGRRFAPDPSGAGNRPVRRRRVSPTVPIPLRWSSARARWTDRWTISLPSDAAILFFTARGDLHDADLIRISHESSLSRRPARRPQSRPARRGPGHADARTHPRPAQTDAAGPWPTHPRLYRRRASRTAGNRGGSRSSSATARTWSRTHFGDGADARPGGSRTRRRSPRTARAGSSSSPEGFCGHRRVHPFVRRHPD